jgi:hypothetical protein
MAFSDVELKLIDKVVGGLCRQRNLPEFKDELSLEFKVEGHDVVLFERRPRWGARVGVTDSPIAKLTFVRTKNAWRLFWRRQDLEWHGYKPLPGKKRLEALVAEVDRDPYGCFFG